MSLHSYANEEYTKAFPNMSEMDSLVSQIHRQAWVQGWLAGVNWITLEEDKAEAERDWYQQTEDLRRGG